MTRPLALAPIALVALLLTAAMPVAVAQTPQVESPRGQAPSIEGPTDAAQSVSARSGGVSDGRIAFRLRFDDHGSGSVEDWLKAKGFVFERDAKNRSRIDTNVSDDGLVIEAKRKAFGILTNEAVNVPVFTTIEIDWGVSEFPDGVGYEAGVRNEAIMVHAFMGDERISSGSMLIPDSPYFIGLFLCNGDDRVDYPYVGSYFKKGGRYVCLEKPLPGVLITSRYDLLAAYREFFDRDGDDDPAISGIAIEVDTSKAKGDGRAIGFVREIRFYR